MEAALIALVLSLPVPTSMPSIPPTPEGMSGATWAVIVLAVTNLIPLAVWAVKRFTDRDSMGAQAAGRRAKAKRDDAAAQKTVAELWQRYAEEMEQRVEKLERRVRELESSARDEHAQCERRIAELRDTNTKQQAEIEGLRRQLDALTTGARK
jgi:uncharacterized coiled-coil protein SlyX